MNRKWILQTALLCLAWQSLEGEIIKMESDTICGQSPSPYRATLRHLEARGIGYESGYTTLDLFLTLPEPIDQKWFPFLDLRGHLFNGGKFAANAGLGLRFLEKRVWGINGYYDFRKTDHVFNQLGLGLESLGKTWDFRMNGYLPMGKKIITKEKEFNADNPKNKIVKTHKTFAMQGLEGEIGFHVKKIREVPLYFATGPYYLWGEDKAAWGGKIRLSADFFKYFRLEFNVSYDTVFNLIPQGQISFIIPFGAKKEVIKRKGFSCSRTMLQRKLAMQRVDRNEIIVIEETEKKKEVEKTQEELIKDGLISSPQIVSPPASDSATEALRKENLGQKNSPTSAKPMSSNSTDSKLALSSKDKKEQTSEKDEEQKNLLINGSVKAMTFNSSDPELEELKKKILEDK